MMYAGMILFNEQRRDSLQNRPLSGEFPRCSNQTAHTGNYTTDMLVLILINVNG